MRPILFVEDDPSIRAATARMLRAFGEVVTANDVEGALTLLAAIEPRAVLADLALGDQAGGGFEVLRAVRELHPGVLIALVSGFHASAILHEAAVLGAAFIPKPDYTMSALLPFFDRVASRDAGVVELGHAITAAAAAWSLTPRERQLLPWLLTRKTADEICALAGYRQATYKTHVNALLRKAACPDTREVVIAIYRMATATGAGARRTTDR